MTANADHELYRFPTTIAGTSDITAIPIPKQPTPTGLYGPLGDRPVNPQGITTGIDGNVYMANHQAFSTGVVEYGVSSGAFTNYTMPYGAYQNAGRYIVAGSDGDLYVTSNGNCTVEPCGGGLAWMPTDGTNPFTAIPLPHAASAPDDIAAEPGASGGTVAFVDLGIAALGTYSHSTGQVREYPVVAYADPAPPLGTSNGGLFPDGVTYYNGDPWFITYSADPSTGRLQIGHVIMTSSWSIWPSENITLWGTGSSSAQSVGLMENGENGPFNLSSSNPNVAQITHVGTSDHDYEIFGNGPGTCTITITDSHGRSESVTVNVTATGGTVQSRRSGIRKGGSI
jgi:hypothetical protein